MANFSNCPNGRVTIDINHIFQMLPYAKTIIMQLSDVSGNISSLNAWTETSRIEHLHLFPTDEGSRLSLFGTIPPSFCDLQQLHTLRLHSTSLAGLSLDCKRAVTQLRVFDLQDASRFNMHIDSLATLFPSLIEIDLGGTQVSGASTSLRRFPLLQYVDVTDTNVYGGLVQGLQGLENIREVYIARSQIKGYIDPDIALLTSLEVLSAAKTALAGIIPPEIGRLPNLKVLDLSYTNIAGTFPESLANITTLQLLDLSYLTLASPSSLMEDIGNLENLSMLLIAQSNLVGTIPQSLAKLKNLYTINLLGNHLTGTIPSELHAKNIDLSFNALTGTVPFKLARYAYNLDLHHNMLGPNMDMALFLGRSGPGNRFVFSQNSFAGTLPDIPVSLDSVYFQVLDFSHNNFSGAISNTYHKVAALYLDYNSLSGGLIELFNSISHIRTLSASHNKFTGAMPDWSKEVNLLYVDLSFNQLEQPLSPIPSSCASFYASNNLISGELSLSFVMSVALSPSLRVLDLSKNLIFLPFHGYLNVLLYSNLTYLSLASNPLRTSLHDYGPAKAASWLNELVFANTQNVFHHGLKEDPFRISDSIFYSSPLLYLDLSNCSLEGSFPIERTFPKLNSLNLGNNDLVGDPSLGYLMPSLAQVNISGNRFVFDASDIHDFASLITFDGRDNLIFGTVSLNNLPLLQYFDLSQNKLHRPLDLRSFKTLFTQYQLRQLNVAQNSELPFFDEDYSTFGLSKTESSAPYKTPGLTTGIVCFVLSFSPQQEDRIFTYDEKLFAFNQCECDSNHFGRPFLEGCIRCPSDGGLKVCKASSLVGESNAFLFPVRFFSSSNSQLLLSQGSSSTSNDSTPPTMQKPHMHRPFFQVVASESCAYNVMQQLSGKTNCKGANITEVTMDMFPHATFEEMLAKQCRNGSEGRLCSKCTCDHTADGCWFNGGAFCKQCSIVFSNTQALILFLSVGIVAFCASIVIFFFVLRSKRVAVVAAFEDLNFFKRALYRLLLLVSLGNVNILITFLQLLAELTHWDAYALTGVLKVLNGSTEGIGLECLLPILRRPFTRFLIRILIPIFAIVFVTLSVLLAEGLYRLTKFCSAPPSADSFDSEAESLILNQSPDAVPEYYPASALITSVSVTIIRFFYFGTAIAASEFLTSDYQTETQKRYSANYPWMLYSDAKPFIAVSIPTLILYVYGFPLAFGILCYRVRHIYQAHSVKVFFGTLFENFSRKYFWWEIFNILRKLVIALIVRGIPSSNAMQFVLVVIMLSMSQVVILSLQPWKRKLENLFDALSAFLLLVSLSTSRSGFLTQANITTNLVIALDAIFVLISLIYMAYLTWTQPTPYHLKIGSEAQLSSLKRDHSITDVDDLVDGFSSDS